MGKNNSSKFERSGGKSSKQVLQASLPLLSIIQYGQLDIIIIFYQANKAFSQMKTSVIKVQLTCKNDVKINWNFTGMLNPKIYKRHVFLCTSVEASSQAFAFSILSKLYQSIKIGDLYTFSTLESTSFEWNQKTKIDPLPHYQQKKKKNVSALSSQCFFNILFSLEKYKEPTFVLIFIDQRNNVSEIQKVASKLRESKNFNPLVMLTSPDIKEKQINFSGGICYLNYNQQDIYQFYRYYDQHIACKQAEIVLESLSGNILLKSTEWQCTQFSTFRRKIHSPLAGYFVDLIETFRLCNKQKRKWKFRLSLNYKLLNNSMYSATKQIQIWLIPDIEKYVTHHIKSKEEKKYNLSWTIQLKKDPFYKQYILQPFA